MSDKIRWGYEKPPRIKTRAELFLLTLCYVIPFVFFGGLLFILAWCIDHVLPIWVLQFIAFVVFATACYSGWEWMKNWMKKALERE